MYNCSVCSYSNQELSWRENPETDGEKQPALLTALLVLILRQLLTDLTVDLISETNARKGVQFSAANMSEKKKTHLKKC